MCFLYLNEIYNEKIKQFANKLNLMRSFYSCIDMNKEEKYVSPDVKLYYKFLN